MAQLALDDYPDRYALANELHARPLPELAAQPGGLPRDHAFGLEALRWGRPARPYQSSCRLTVPVLVKVLLPTGIWMFLLPLAGTS